MSVCARSCCWSPFGCGLKRECACHWDEKKPMGQTGDAASHRDPTAYQAIRNVMNLNRRRK